MDFKTFIMPFGKHAGKCLGDIPADYLFWMVENLGRNCPLEVSAYVDKFRATLEKEYGHERDSYRRAKSDKAKRFISGKWD